MKKHKIIGKEVRIPIIHWNDRFWGEDDLPAFGNYPAVSRWVRAANFLRTSSNSPWRDDARLIARPSADTDADGRGRDGLPVIAPCPDIELIRELYLMLILKGRRLPQVVTQRN